MMKRSLSLGLIAAWWLATGSAANAQAIIYDNGSTGGPGTHGIVTNPGAAFGGGDLSALIAPDANFGFSANSAGPFRLSDQFVVPAGQTWTINNFHVYTYTTGATAPTVTAGTFQIFNGAPNAGGTVIAGDTTTNVLTADAFAGPTAIWRAQDTAPLTNNRQVQDATLTPGAAIVLSPGTYWFDFGLTYSTGAGFVPPLSTPVGGAVTGDALQSVGGVYAPLVDGTVPKGIPFSIVGTVSAVPEPGSMALCGVAVAGAFASWRRRRAAK